MTDTKGIGGAAGSRIAIGDAALARLRAVVDEPDVQGTRYELVEPIGRGGMGSVWRALDRQLERDVALKVLAEPDEAVARELAARLVQEAKVLARLEHPGIVPVHDVGVLADGRAFCAMKLVRGRRLDHLLQQEGEKLTEADRFRVFARICETVAFAHARGVLHRDLKPANVMVGEFGEVLVLDWGLARLDGGSEEGGGSGEAGVRMGTPGFMAPELETGAGGADARADVFALGRLLAGLGFQGRALDAIVAKATAAVQDERYASVAALAQDVARFQAGEPVSALPEGGLAKLARIYRRYRAAIWLIGAYALARAAFEVIRQYRSGDG